MPSSLFESVFNSSSTGSCLLSPTSEAIILAVNDAYLKQSLRSQSELVGVGVFAAFPSNPNDPEDTGEHSMRNSIAHVIATGQVDTLPVQRYPIRVTFPDGKTVYEERFWSAANIPVFDKEGKLLCISHTATDITEKVRSDLAIRESEEQFRLMANVVPQIVWITDAEGRVQFFNRHWSDYTGISYELRTATEVAAAVVHPDDVAVTIERFEQAKRSGDTFLVEHRIKAASGDYRWFLVRGEPYRDPNTGQIIQWFGASVDIHDRKQAEETLRMQTDRQAFQLALADCIRPLTDPEEVTAAASELLGKYLNAKRVIYGEVDDSGEFVVMNRGWTDGTVASMEGVRLRGNDFGPLIMGDLFAGRILAIDDVSVNEKSASFVDAYLAQGVRSLLAIPLMKAGRLRAVLSVHHPGVRHWTESEVAMANDLVDRTWAAVDSARAQARLLIERDRSQSVFDSMTEGFALFDHDWTVLEMNVEGLRISRRTHDQVIGKNYWEVWPETVGTEGERMFRRAWESRQPEVLEYQQNFNDASARWVEVRAYPAGERDLAVFFRDITDRKAVEQKLKEADRRKDDFLAMLAHELRNPLAPISAASQLLQIAKLDEARIHRTSQIIDRQVSHMTHLINDLLDVSRVTRGMVELEKTPIDIRHIITDAVEQVAPLMQSRRHHLALHLPPDTTMMMGDKKRLVQVLANILNNAAKYTNEGGNILLKTDVREEHLLIEVVDDGIGMTPELATHVFDLFAQAERSSDRSSGGLGLGLALVKSLAELHGGTVTCESKGIGKGSRFTLCLPRMVDSIEQAPLQAMPCLKNTAPPPRLLVVDDNEDAAVMLAFLLEAMGHEVLVEHEARRALERAKIEMPHVCLLDICLPEMDGNQLAQRLPSERETANAVLNAVTGYGQEEDRKNTLAAGFGHHLVKPVDIEKLTSILAGVSRP